MLRSLTSTDATPQVCLPSGNVIYTNSTKGGGRVCDEDGNVREEWPAGGGGGGGQEGDLLSAKLGQHLGVRVGSRGGLLDVFFVCDGDGGKSSRVKHMFTQGSMEAAPKWDAKGPFGSGAPPSKPRRPRFDLLALHAKSCLLHSRTSILKFEGCNTLNPKPQS